jgi:chemoreceptor zinc-binding protein
MNANFARLEESAMDTSLDSQITLAISAHAKWKSRLKTAIASGNCDIDVATAARDNVCDFGRWLHTGVSLAQKQAPQYAACVELHARFHRAAAEVLKLAIAGKKEDATRLLTAVDGDFSKSSVALTHEMMAWKRAA